MESGYSVDVKTALAQAKLMKSKVLDDLQEKLAMQAKLYTALMDNSKSLVAAFDSYAEHFKEIEPSARRCLCDRPD